MAVAFDANATADSTANGVTSINHTNLTIGSGSNRAVIAQIGWSGTVTSPALKWDNAGTPQSMTVITNAGATNTVRAELWGLVAPTSGNKTLNAAWTTARDVVVNGTSFTGVDQTGGTTSFPNGVGATGTGTSSPQTMVTITSAVGDFTVAIVGTVSTPSAPTQTQTFLDSSPATESVAGSRAVGAATVAHGWTIAGAQAWAAAGTDIKAAASVTFIAAEPLMVRQAVNRAGTY